MAEDTDEVEKLEIFAVAAPGLEPLLANEMREMGLHGTAEAGGVTLEGTVRDVQLLNLNSRIATRVLVRIATFRARTFHELERHARRIGWDGYLAPGSALHLRVSCSKSKLYHEGAVAQRLHEAAADRVPGLNVATDTADEDGEIADRTQMMVVRFLHDRCTVSVDSSGAALHRRGYRQAIARAPLRETLAASLLRACEWGGDEPLVDPMCGSGTIPIEAALISRQIAPGIASAGLAAREFAFEHWPRHDPDPWTSLVDAARERVRPSAGPPIIGADRDAGAVRAATENAARAGVADDVEIRQGALSTLTPPEGTGLLLTNPPYGVRVTPGAELRNLYAALGRLAHDSLPGWTIALLSADSRLDRQLRLPLEKRLTTRNGGIPVHLAVGRSPT